MQSIWQWHLPSFHRAPFCRCDQPCQGHRQTDKQTGKERKKKRALCSQLSAYVYVCWDVAVVSTHTTAELKNGAFPYSSIPRRIRKWIRPLSLFLSSLYQLPPHNTKLPAHFIVPPISINNQSQLLLLHPTIHSSPILSYLHRLFSKYYCSLSGHLEREQWTITHW